MLPPEKRARIIAALKTNPNATAVARKVGGVSCQGVCNIAKQAGIKLRIGQGPKGGRISPEKRARIVAALKANPDTSAVARKVGGVSQSAVWNIAKQNGIELTAGKAARGHLPPEKRAQIIVALKATPNASAVARQIGGVSYQAVWKIAKQTGIK
jgi:hypothetical protein